MDFKKAGEKMKFRIKQVSQKLDLPVSTIRYPYTTQPANTGTICSACNAHGTPHIACRAVSSVVRLIGSPLSAKTGTTGSISIVCCHASMKISHE